MKLHTCLILLGCLIAAGCGGPSGDTPGGTPPAGPEPADAAAPADQQAAAPATNGPIKVAFVTNNTSDFWTIAEAGTKKAASELGCTVLFRKPSMGTAQEQQAIIEDVIVSGATGVAISPNDPLNWTETLNKFAEKVNLVTQDSDAPDSNRVCYIGTNNYDAGVAAAELIKKSLPAGGKIMMFVGQLDAQNAQDRMRGIEETLAGTNISIINTLTDETDRAKAMANVQDTLVTNPDVACLVGLWSYNGPAILNGVRDSGKLGQVKIVCFDEEEETLLGVAEGHIEGTIVQQPFEFGYQSVRLLVQLAKGDRSGVPESKQLFVPVKTITKENVDEFRATLSEQIGR
ncbi:MAG: sugar-binding protein [Candidatus Hydrogenedentes bacterium]|nr:sugar-binding protein [Candidatus Hydrogenedentota bacterium]